MKPVLVEPTLVRPPWGGLRLGLEFGKGEGAIGESWELWHENRLVGRPGTVADLCDLPILVKLIDTRDVLSVQVHPGGDAARARGHPHGKAEAWVVLDAAPGSRLAWGLRHELTRDQLRAHAITGEIEADLAWFHPRAGDVIEVPPGTIHAIGPGLLLYEVQEPIDLTWRLYDWGRGRPLHLDDACEVAIRTASRDPARQVRTTGPRTPLVAHACFGLSLVVGATTLQSVGWEALTATAGSLAVDGVAVRAGATAILPPGAHALAGEGTALVASHPRSRQNAATSLRHPPIRE